jgi:hypothetical protein
MFGIALLPSFNEPSSFLGSDDLSDITVSDLKKLVKKVIKFGVVIHYPVV